MKRIAEALVECGYAKAYQGELGHYFLDTGDYQFDILIREKCDSFADTLEGRRQADALEDWLQLDHMGLWRRSVNECNRPNTFPTHQWRLDRIKWCFFQLEDENNGV